MLLIKICHNLYYEKKNFLHTHLHVLYTRSLSGGIPVDGRHNKCRLFI